MNPISYLRSVDSSSAIAASLGNSNASYLGGGTNLIDLMKLGVEQPSLLIDVNDIPYSKIEGLQGGSLRLGALAKNSDVAHHPEVQKRFPVLSQALLAGASAQLRNMATVGGNLLQRTRCTYFNDLAFPCNKRKPGSGCPAISGFNRNLAILGTSDSCIATNPSDMNVALAAIDPMIQVQGPTGTRTIAFSRFHLLPGATPERETVLERGELITAVDLPDMPFARRSIYIKVRDRASYEFALVSVAVILDLDGKHIRSARVALGGVGTKPWRSAEAEKFLTGSSLSESTFTSAGEAAVAGAKTYSNNGFKKNLARLTIARAIREAGELKI